MNNSVLGLVIGIALGFAGVLGGFGAFLLVLVLAAIGLAVGRWLDGQLDLDEIGEQLRGAASQRGRGRL